MRARSMNVEDLQLRGAKTFNPRRVQSQFVRNLTNPDDDENIDPLKLSPFPPVKEVYSEHF